jgi:hypothetical protein
MGAIFMMKFNTKLAITLVAATTSVFGLASGAMAGEGGAAGAAAFTITGTQVTGVGVASAIGKNDASAYAYNNGTTSNTAGALGSAGAVTLTNAAAGSFTITGTADTTVNLAVGQANDFTATTTIQLGTGTGSNIVNIGPTP